MPLVHPRDLLDHSQMRVTAMPLVHLHDLPDLCHVSWYGYVSFLSQPIHPHFSQVRWSSLCPLSTLEIYLTSLL